MLQVVIAVQVGIPVAEHNLTLSEKKAKACQFLESYFIKNN